MNGIVDQKIHDTRIAIIDAETTGLTPGYDRIVELSVVQMRPDGETRLVLDTLINPGRPIAATEIHGITDRDVTNAPTFSEIAGDVVKTLSGCVIASYNVYFDLNFLINELGRVGVGLTPPHFCLMYMRPMLGIGPRCKLTAACREQDIKIDAAHVSACDALASAELLAFYRKILTEKKIVTFWDLAKLKKYKFLDSFRNQPLPAPHFFNLSESGKFVSRYNPVGSAQEYQTRRAKTEYFDTLNTILADLRIEDGEIDTLRHEKERLNLSKEQIRSLHAKIFAGAINRFTDDEFLDDTESAALEKLWNCLSTLGWAPGEP